MIRKREKVENKTKMIKIQAIKILKDFGYIYFLF